ncbi:UNVERIFIED_CONTAM: STE20-like serine/threonine-protein kinase [Trichonephila clavipes]
MGFKILVDSSPDGIEQQIESSEVKNISIEAPVKSNSAMEPDCTSVKKEKLRGYDIPDKAVQNDIKNVVQDLILQVDKSSNDSEKTGFVSHELETNDLNLEKEDKMDTKPETKCSSQLLSLEVAEETSFILEDKTVPEAVSNVLNVTDIDPIKCINDESHHLISKEAPSTHSNQDSIINEECVLLIKDERSDHSISDTILSPDVHSLSDKTYVETDKTSSTINKKDYNAITAIDESRVSDFAIKTENNEKTEKSGKRCELSTEQNKESTLVTSSNDQTQIILRRKEKPPTFHVKRPGAVSNTSQRIRQKTLKKTRKFMIDGVVVTTTTSKVIYGDEDKQMKEDHVLSKEESILNHELLFIKRKLELRELKMLQKLETKQFQDLSAKAQTLREQAEKRFEQEMSVMVVSTFYAANYVVGKKLRRIVILVSAHVTILKDGLKEQHVYKATSLIFFKNLIRGYDADLEALVRQQKQQLDRAEQQQDIDLKIASKKVRAEQDRELRAFRENLKHELKLLKHEIDLLPKDKRKDAFKEKKEKLDIEHSEKELEFLKKLNINHELSMKRLSDSYAAKIALLECQFLQQKQQLLRAREAAIWELEERHLQEKHQLSKRQLKDIFFLQRHQMLVRHEKELEQVKRMNACKEEELLKWQAIERRQLPKRIRAEMKTRELMFRESLRISVVNLSESPDEEREKVRKNCFLLANFLKLPLQFLFGSVCSFGSSFSIFFFINLNLKYVCRF